MAIKRLLQFLLVLIVVAVAAGFITQGRVRHEVENLERHRVEILARPIKEIRAGTLRLAIEQMAAQSGCRIEIDEATMKTVSIDVDAPFMQYLFDLPLKDALRIALDQDRYATSLDWRWREDAIEVTTREKAYSSTVLAIYDVRDLLQSFDWPFCKNDAPSFPLSNASTSQTGSGAGGSGGGGGGLFAGPAPPPSPAVSLAQLREGSLVGLVEDTIASDTWRDAGGTTGSMGILDGRLFVTQTHVIHLELAKFLQDLREHPDPSW